ncbi:MAG: IS5 family transposase, partial [Rhodospirillales bacterium]|nr:IS5 family transposase [Acetobacter sp.]
MGPHPPPHARPPQLGRSHRLVAGLRRLLVRSRQRGGDTIGPNPTDRGKPGTKRHLVVDRGGLPLALTLTGANRHDSKTLIEVVDAIQPVRQRRGRPRKRPAKLHADKGYDFGRCRRDLRTRGITPSIARRGIESSKHLGKHRWVVERTFAWINQFRRLVVRYERHADLYRAFLII